MPRALDHLPKIQLPFSFYTHAIKSLKEYANLNVPRDKINTEVGLSESNESLASCILSE